MSLIISVSNFQEKTPRALLILIMLFYCNIIHSSIIGSPPIKIFEIPREEFSQHFDMVQDNENHIVIAYTQGVKVFDGVRWKSIKLPVNRFLRKLYFDNDKRIYIGGWDIIGYLEKDIYGQYQFTDLTPKPIGKSFNSIWDIVACENTVYFSALRDVFSYDKNTKLVNQWSFDSKLGAIACINNEIILQDRSIGLKTFKNEKWSLTDIDPSIKDLIYAIEPVNDETAFLLSSEDNWKVLENNKTKNIQLSGQVLHQENYVEVETISNESLVLGSNNGLLTIVNLETYDTESFQISNDWIVSIVKSKNGGFLVLTEYDLFYVSWPSPWREQSTDTGLASDLLDLINHNGVVYALSSSGVFKEELTEYNNQRKSFIRLNWTNKEAWDLYVTGQNNFIMAESQKLYLIKENSISPISDVIYPRDFYPSVYKPGLIYIRTEFNLKAIQLDDKDQWVIRDIYDDVLLSMIELNEKSLLISTFESGLIKLDLDTDQKVIGIERVSKQMASIIANTNGVTLKRLVDEIFAITDDGVYKLINNQFEVTDLYQVDNLIDLDEIVNIYKSPDNRLWLTSTNKIVYQDKNLDWQLLDITANMRGVIGELIFLEEAVKISAGDKLLTFIESYSENNKNLKGKLQITDINLYQGYQIHKQLPIKPLEPLKFEMKSGEIVFNYVFNDLENIENILYSYRLKGVNDRWSKFSNIAEVSFNNLAANIYEFELQAKDTLGNIHRLQPYKFEVVPKWYLSLYAKIIWSLLSFVILWVILFYFLKWREKVHEIQKQELKKVINERTLELKMANNRLQEMAHTDGLTGLSNRLYIDKFIDKLVKNETQKVSVLMLDMDHFKKYNDTKGHLEGDKLLINLASILKNNIDKERNLIARYGGEEFLIIMPNTDSDEVLKSAELIRKLIENKQENISISIGVSSSQQKLNSVDNIYKLIDKADQGLYMAKSQGRNRVYVS